MTRVLLAVAIAYATSGFAMSAGADGISLASSFGCSYTAGDRGGTFTATSTVDAPGVVVAISVSPANIVTYMGKPGDPFGGGRTASAEFGTGPGPSSVAFSLTVRWETGGPGGGPREETVNHTLPLNPCLPNPSAALASTCDGKVVVTMKNGEPNDTTGTGGQARFEILGAGGYRAGPFEVQPWGGPFTHEVPARSAGSVTVQGEGRIVAVGGYVAAPGCVGYVAPQPNQPTVTPSATPAASAAPSVSPEPSPSSAPAAAVTTGPPAAPSPKGSSWPLIGGAILLLLAGGVAGLLHFRRRAQDLPGTSQEEPGLPEGKPGRVEEQP